ncbi:MAG: DUF1624 domain-containing protein [Spirochaetes bacterium]|nr:DUF1624 domain-containing protein [Spirochaetota bacterium]
MQDIKRNAALDLLRGLTIALMIIVNNPGDWKQMFQVLRHAEWDGFLGADIVFPLFLFVAGFAAAMKVDRLTGIQGTGPHCASALTLDAPEEPPYYLPLIRRASILFAIGLFLNAWPFGLLPGTEFHPEKLRVFGVLQRIALCVLIGGFILRKCISPRATIFALIVMAAIYEIGMRLPLVTTAAGTFGRSFALTDNFARLVDTSILPDAMLYKVQKIPFDPEGLFTTLTAVATFLIGALCYRLPRGGGAEAGRGFGRVYLATSLAVAGVLMAFIEPVNKNLWTLPYALLTGAAGVILLSFLEMLRFTNTGWGAWFLRPISYMGMNPLVIYVLSGIIGKALAVTKMASGLSLKAILFNSLAILPASGPMLSLLYSLLLLLVLACMTRLIPRLSA